MTFQFLCPQGHLLEGEEEHMGMQCQCPQCGTAFIIPTLGQSDDVEVEVEEEAPAAAAEIELEPLEPLDAMRPLDAGLAAPLPAPRAAARQAVEEDDEDVEIGEALLHIPCPNGHELETPAEMIGQKAKCPHCGVVFKLMREESVEYQRQQEILERRQAKFWFQTAVIVAGFVVVVLIAMIIIAAVR
ncbi:MAG: hypothetical protein AB7O59_06560 [Pirellulales bacterium]